MSLFGRKRQEIPAISADGKIAELSVISVSFVLKHLSDGFFLFDADSNLVFINEQAEKFFEVNEKEVLNKKILKLNNFNALRSLVSILGGDVREVFREVVTVNPNLILEITSTSMKANNIKIGTIVAAHDITREKIVERAKSDFVTLAAHQLRTPTSGIKWSLRMLLDGDVGQITPQQKEIIGKAYVSNDKVIDLVNDLLNVARIEEGKFLTKISKNNIEEIVESAARTFTENLNKRKIKMEIIKPAESLPPVMVDKDKITMALENLIDNSTRYTPNGGKITIVIERNEKHVHLQIRDNGYGIPLGQQHKVFTKFFRADNTMKVETEGTGLGLFIVKNIIEAHGGSIWFESAQGRGTTFFINLPLKEKFGEYLTEEFY